MAAPVKVSDRLLALAKKEADSTHRSATAQIEHWATLGRAVEVMAAYRDVLALKRLGNALPMPAFVPREAVHGLLERLVTDPDRESVKARIRAGGGPLYVSDPAQPGTVTIQASGVPTHEPVAARRVAAARRKSARKRA
jgi:ParD-like antitoxin of type II bacterial toxin-antitoxin system